MHEHILTGLTLIVVLGIGSQWLAWRLKLPSILLLLLAGFIAGPVCGILRPDALFKDLLEPVVSVSVAIILFEGGLSLRYSELKDAGRVMRNLVTIGVLVTWALSTVAAMLLMQLPFTVACLLGAILVVTGPTVVLPLLRHLRLKGRVNSILKWEGIMNDPVGAALAVLVFEALLDHEAATSIVVFGIVKTLVIGIGFSLIAAPALVFLLRRYWIPDHLQAVVTLASVIGVFTVSNHLQPESGLLSVTLMGVILANQQSAQIRHLVEFKEHLRTLLLSSLFIVLAARIDLDNFYAMGWPGIAFFATLVVVVRPAAVLASTVGMSLAWKEKLFLMWMAPRGVVAAAVTSVFALRMLDMGYEGANVLVPTVFTVIAGTVALYGLTAGLLARVLKLADPSPQGVVIIGAHALAREIAQVLKKENQKTLLVDSNWKQVTEARQKGLKAYYGDVMSEHIFDKVDFSGMGRMIAMTSNDEINALAALHFRDLFGRNEVYQLVPPQAGAGVQNRTSAPRHLRGRTLFGPKITFSHLYDRVEHGAQVKATQLTEEYAFAKFRQQHSTAIPLFTITESGNLHVVTEEGSRQPRPGDRLIFLYQEEKETSVQSQPPASDTEKPALP